MMRKKCRKCGRRRVLDAFAKNKGMPDGHINTCKTCHAAYARGHYQQNKETYIQKSAAWQKQNIGKARRSKAQTAKRFRESHPEIVRDRHRQYKKDNPQQFAEYENRRRALKVTQQVEKIDRAEIYDRDNGTCHICNRKVSFRRMELDHVQPLSRGGSHTAANLKVAHPTCNRRKWANSV